MTTISIDLMSELAHLQEADRLAHGGRSDADQHRRPGPVADEDGRLHEVQGERARGRGGQGQETPRYHRRHADALPAHEVSDIE